MGFLGDLLIIAAGIGALVALFAIPRTTMFLGCALVAGYIGSAEGFLGTCAGLAIGGIAGAVLAGVFSLFAHILSPAEKNLTAGPLPSRTQDPH